MVIALEFDTREEYEKYKKEHRIEQGTKIHIKNEVQKEKPEEKPKQEKSEQEKPKDEKKTQPQKGFFSDKELNLPDTAVQPIKTKEELYGSAKEAQEQMMQWLDKGEGIDKKLGLKHYDLSKPEQQSIDFDKAGPILITAPPKGEKRAKEKVEADYGGDWSRLTDAVRATIAVDTFDEVGKVMDTLRASGMQLAKKPKDRFQKPTPVGYRDIMMNVKYPNGHIGELQVHIKSMLKVKEIGHKMYEKVRDIESKLAKTKMEDLSKEEQKIYADTNQEMSNLYGKAWDDMQGKKASIKIASKTKYYNFNDNPSEWVSTKVPIMWVKGKRMPVYNMFRFVHEAEEIDKNEFDKMMAHSKNVKSFIGQTLNDEQIQDIAKKVIEQTGQSVQLDDESNSNAFLSLDEEGKFIEANRRSDMNIQKMLIASVATMSVYRRLAQLSDEEKSEVIDKVKEKMNLKEKDAPEDTTEETPKDTEGDTPETTDEETPVEEKPSEETPVEETEEVSTEEKEEVPSEETPVDEKEEVPTEDTSVDLTEEVPVDEDSEEETNEDIPSEMAPVDEEKPEGITEEEPVMPNSEMPSEDEDEEDEDDDEEDDDDDQEDKKDEMSSIVENLVEEMQVIKQDGHMSSTEVLRLITQMMEMVNLLVEAKAPTRRRKKSSQAVREFIIASKL
jgi:hypothetical protein